MYLVYHDGNLQSERFRYYGLRSLVLPRSKSNVANFEVGDSQLGHDFDILYNVNSFSISYITVQAELADLGKGSGYQDVIVKHCNIIARLRF